MNKYIKLLIAIIVILMFTSTSASAATKVAKPTISVVEANPGTTKLSVKCSTKNAKIYYTTNGTTPTTKSKSVKSNSKKEFNTKDLSKIKFRAYANGSYSATVSAPKYKEVAEPTYSVTVTDKGDIQITLTSSTSNATIYYNFKSSGTLNKKDKAIKSGETFTISYRENKDVFQFVAYANNTYSKRVNINLKNYVHEKYNQMLKDIIASETKNATTDEEKLIALWDWTMMNSYYARKTNGAPDMSYMYAEDIVFSEKAVCNGFAYFWRDITKLAGFETEYLSDRGMNHAFCVTKVKGEWFIVDPTHEDKEINKESSVFYDGLLNNDLYADYSTSYKGYDCSSRRYLVDDSSNITYFQAVSYVESGDAWFTYDDTNDRYLLHDIYE